MGLGLGVDETFRRDRTEHRHNRGVGVLLRVNDRGEPAQGDNSSYPDDRGLSSLCHEPFSNVEEDYTCRL